MTTLLQVCISDEELKKRLELTAEYSEKHKAGALSNCANLVFVLLDLVTEPESYLSKCYTRDRGTDLDELDTISKEALHTAHIVYTGTSNNINTIKVGGANSWRVVIQGVAAYVEKGKATPLGVEFHNGSQHLILLRKRLDGMIEIIDPQSIHKNIFKQGEYPLKQELRENTLALAPLYGFDPHLKMDSVYFFTGPSLTQEQSLLAKSTLSEAIMHETQNYGYGVGQGQGQQGGKRHKPRKHTIRTQKQKQKQTRKRT